MSWPGPLQPLALKIFLPFSVMSLSLGEGGVMQMSRLQVRIEAFLKRHLCPPSAVHTAETVILKELALHAGRRLGEQSDASQRRNLSPRRDCTKF